MHALGINVDRRGVPCKILLFDQCINVKLKGKWSGFEQSLALLSANADPFFDVFQIATADWDCMFAERDDFRQSVVEQFNFADMVDAHQILAVATHQGGFVFQCFQRQLRTGRLAIGANMHTAKVTVYAFHLFDRNKKDAVVAYARDMYELLGSNGGVVRFRCALLALLIEALQGFLQAFGFNRLEQIIEGIVFKGLNGVLIVSGHKLGEWTYSVLSGKKRRQNVVPT